MTTKNCFCWAFLFPHVSRKRTITSECCVVKTYNKDYFIPVILLSYTTKLRVKCFAIVTGFHKTYMILKKAKWHRFWRSWDILVTKAAIPTIFYHQAGRPALRRKLCCFKKYIFRLLMRFSDISIDFRTTSCCTNSLMAGFWNDDYFKIGFVGACFQKVILFLINPYY